MIYCFDLDNTLCLTNGNDYENSKPIKEMISKVNYLYDNGNIIKIFTARGMGSLKGDVKSVHEKYLYLTNTQIQKWGIKCHEIILGKPSYDMIIDDKSCHINEFKKQTNPKIGIIAGMFDIIHPGYVEMFIECKKHCDKLIVLIHEDASIERKEKMSPILSTNDRKNILESIKYIDEVIIYKTENDLLEILKNSNLSIRFLGDDYKNKKFTGDNLDLEIFWINRNHGWSSSKFKKLIKESV